MTAPTEEAPPVSLEDLGIETIDISAKEATTDSAPNRRRGRPPGSKNKPKLNFGSINDNSNSDTISENSDSSPVTNRRPRAASRTTKTAIRAACAELVAMANLGLLIVSKDDALNEPEMDMLTNAVAAEAMSSERVMKWLLATSGITPHILMIRAVVMIGVPRLQRRGILPKPKEIVMTREIYNSMTPEQQRQYNEYLKQQSNGSVQAEAESASASNNTDTPIYMEAGGAPVTNW